MRDDSSQPYKPVMGRPEVIKTVLAALTLAALAVTAGKYLV